jgi:uncharacterized protein with HEPN domain
MPANDQAHLHHMLEASREALEFMKGQNLNELKNNHLLLLAMTRILEIIGEAAGQVSLEGRKRYDSLPWDALVNMRGKLMKASMTVDPYMVWSSVNTDLPPLITALEKVTTPSDQNFPDPFSAMNI